jgi:hypothetical protein
LKFNNAFRCKLKEKEEFFRGRIPLEINEIAGNDWSVRLYETSELLPKHFVDIKTDDRLMPQIITRIVRIASLEDNGCPLVKSKLILIAAMDHPAANNGAVLPEKRMTAISKEPQKKCTGLHLPVNPVLNLVKTLWILTTALKKQPTLAATPGAFCKLPTAFASIAACRRSASKDAKWQLYPSSFQMAILAIVPLKLN